MLLTDEKTFKNKTPFTADYNHTSITLYGDDDAKVFPYLREVIGYRTSKGVELRPKYQHLDIGYLHTLHESEQSSYDYATDALKTIQVYSIVLTNQYYEKPLFKYPAPEQDRRCQVKLRGVFALEYNQHVYTTATCTFAYIPNLEQMTKSFVNQISDYAELDSSHKNFELAGVYPNIEHSGNAHSLLIGHIDTQTLEYVHGAEYDVNQFLSQLIRLDVLSLTHP